MKTNTHRSLLAIVILFLPILLLYQCRQIGNETLIELKRIGLVGEEISAENFYKGIAPKNFRAFSGAKYKPSFNEDPGIPAQCWIETGYGTQNACKYCHTDYLASIEHGNAYPIGEDQITYSFPTANLNRILWQNIIYPEKIEERLNAEGINLPNPNDVHYVRTDNWLPTFSKARANGNTQWINAKARHKSFILFPALNPMHLFPYSPSNPTSNGKHGYIDPEGFIRSETNEYTGWRAINFFPYAIFTPLTGSVSGIYIRLPKEFMCSNSQFSVEVYKENLELLESNIKNEANGSTHYKGDASAYKIRKGFYPVGTEFAHPLHYVDLFADGETGTKVDGVESNTDNQYEFPGTRSKRVKEIRYMYKWKDVELIDIALPNDDDTPNGIANGFENYLGREGQGWVDNGAGWILAAYIENRNGELRPQTTEELAQCIGCHAKVGNTIDAVWSFQRKLPGLEGWADMHYGHYNSKQPNETYLNDYLNVRSGMGELGYFFHSVVGADLYGIMPNEIRTELYSYAEQHKLFEMLKLKYPIDEILSDEILKNLSKEERKPRLMERQKIMRHYTKNRAYLQQNNSNGEFFLKGNIFYPTHETMKANIQGYRKIVLDQSFNLGKDLFGSVADNIPFTFRSDGTARDEKSIIIPVGHVIYSRPYNKNGIGITPTGIVEGDAIDSKGNYVEEYTEEDVRTGKITFTGTLDLLYNPILSGIKLK